MDIDTYVRFVGLRASAFQQKHYANETDDLGDRL